MSKGAMEDSVNVSLGFSRDVKPMKTFEAPKEHPDFDISRFEWAKLHLHALTKHRFFGKATFIVEDGKIIRLIKEESFKP